MAATASSERFGPISTTSGRRAVWSRRLMSGLLYAFLVAVGVLCLMPFYFMLSGSLMDRGEMFKIPPHFWPDKLIFENYRELFRRFPFLTYLRNSLIVSVAQTVGVLFFCSLAGFVFAKRRFPGRNGLFLFVLATSVMPNGQTTIIPFYLLMVKLHWVGTYWRIVLPLSVPGLVVIGVMQFIAIWNDFLYGLLVLKSDEMRTVTVALTELARRTQANTLYGPLFAGIVLATLPTIAIFFIFQRRLTQGILSGSIRG